MGAPGWEGVLRYPYRVAVLIWLGIAAFYVVMRVQSGDTLGEVRNSMAGTIVAVLAGFGIAHLTGYRADLWPSSKARTFLLGIAVGGLAAVLTVVLVPFVTGITVRTAMDAMMTMTFLLVATSCFLAFIGVIQIAQAAWREKPREPKPVPPEQAPPPA